MPKPWAAVTESPLDAISMAVLRPVFSKGWVVSLNGVRLGLLAMFLNQYLK